MYIKLLKCPSAVVLSYIHTATCHDIKYVHNYYHECDFNKSFYLTIFNVSYRKPSLRTLTQSFNLQRYESFNIIWSMTYQTISHCSWCTMIPTRCEDTATNFCKYKYLLCLLTHTHTDKQRQCKAKHVCMHKHMLHFENWSPETLNKFKMCWAKDANIHMYAYIHTYTRSVRNTCTIITIKHKTLAIGNCPSIRPFKHCIVPLHYNKI